MKFSERIMQWMAGRNGSDALCRAIFHLYLVLLIVNVFIRSVILNGITLVLAILLLFRMLSKNLPARRAENLRYRNLRTKVFSWFGAQKAFSAFGTWLKKRTLRLKKLNTNRFRTCPHCKAELCLPKKRGKHNVLCPRCRKNFTVHILF